MHRRHFVSVLLASATAAGCDLFGEKDKARLPGDRISVLGLDRRVEPDPLLVNQPISLPPPTVNPEWPEPGGNPTHTMADPALPSHVSKVWETTISDGSAR